MSRRRRIRSVAAFSLGALLAVALPLAAGELYVRWFPSDDFKQFLGDASPLSGPFRSDPAFGVQYRSWDDFRRENETAVAAYLPWIEGSVPLKGWAFFGNSFVQAPGMLADTARSRSGQTNRGVLNLCRNEHLFVRLAQIAMLLERGARPERVFVVLLPLDLAILGQHGLNATSVTPKGAIAFAPRNPGGTVGWAVRNSRLALAAWVRGKRHYADPAFNLGDLTRFVPPSILKDVEHLFGSLAAETAKRGVPVTIVLVPNYEQIARGGAFGFQDALHPLFERLGFDVCDVRRPFVEYPKKPELFIPDKHFSPLGNAMLFDEILAHLRAIGADPATLDGGASTP